MELRSHVFLHRHKRSMKHLCAKQWRSFLDGGSPLQHVPQQFTTTEIEIFTEHNKPFKLQSIRSWAVSIDERGYVRSALATELPKPQLSISLEELFSTKQGIDTIETVLTQYVDALFYEPQQAQPETAEVISLYPVEKFVERLCQLA